MVSFAIRGIKICHAVQIAWMNVWPEAVYDIRRFTMENGVTDIKKAIVDIEEQAGFEVNNANMNKLTESIQEELCMRIWLWRRT